MTNSLHTKTQTVEYCTDAAVVASSIPSDISENIIRDEDEFNEVDSNEDESNDERGNVDAREVTKTPTFIEVRGQVHGVDDYMSDDDSKFLASTRSL